jgi:NAD(P)-dependent dehydrogenase (short-subunit alcohol dehydrogenase family)
MSSNERDLRVAITAGAGGIGRVVAEDLLESGARVAICDLDAAETSSFGQSSERLLAITADVSREEDVDRFVAEVDDRFGGLDVLVNNAGISGPVGPVESIDLAGWQATLNVNLTGAFLTTRRVVPLLRRNPEGGSIINVASTSSLFGTPLRSAYSASKWGLIGLTRTWAMELGRDGIRVNAICPGSVEGGRIEDVIRREAEHRGVSEEAVRNAYLEQTSMRTFVTSEEVAGLVRYLTSPIAGRISGQVIGIDGHTESLGRIRL